MKKNIAYLSMSLLFFAGCKKEFLDKTPVSSLSAATFYKTKADFDQAIVGAYQPLRDVYGTGGPDFGAWMAGEMRSDNTCFTYNTQSRGYIDRENVEQFLDDGNNGVASTKWNNNYIIIGRANQILNVIDKSDLSDEDKANNKGQALFLRAFAYFDLVQNFGDLPLITIPPTNYEQTQVSRSPVADIYKQILSDATAAATLLPTVSNQIKGQVANGAAYTLLGNVYMVLKQWANAEVELKKVEGYSLVNDYASVFNPTNKNNSESIFEVQYLDDPALGFSSGFAYTFLPVLPNPNVITGFPSSSSNNWGGWNTPTPDLISAYETGDKRKAATIGFYSGPSVSATPYSNIPYAKKYVYDAKQFARTNNDWIIYRYAEVLLLIAEALNEQGKSAEGLSYINQVHANVRTGLSALTITDQSGLREAIIKERQIELALENKRWTDLLRWGTAISVMTAHAAKIKANPQAYYYPPGVNPVAASYNIDQHRLLYPVPIREIQANPKMTQNPGY